MYAIRSYYAPLSSSSLSRWEITRPSYWLGAWSIRITSYNVCYTKLLRLVWLALGLSSAVWAAEGVDSLYKLGPGDVVRVTVYDHADLALEAEIAGDGSLRMPLVGSVDLGGMTFTQAEARIAERP